MVDLTHPAILAHWELFAKHDNPPSFIPSHEELLPHLAALPTQITYSGLDPEGLDPVHDTLEMFGYRSSKTDLQQWSDDRGYGMVAHVLDSQDRIIGLAISVCGCSGASAQTYYLVPLPQSYLALRAYNEAARDRWQQRLASAGRLDGRLLPKEQEFPLWLWPHVLCHGDRDTEISIDPPTDLAPDDSLWYVTEGKDREYATIREWRVPAPPSGEPLAYEVTVSLPHDPMTFYIRRASWRSR